MGYMHKERKKVFRTSWQVKAILVAILLGLATLCQWSISLGSKTWVILSLASPLFVLFGMLLKESFGVKVVLNAEKIVYCDRGKRKEVKVKNINRIGFCRLAPFDGTHKKWVFLFLDSLPENSDDDSFSYFGQGVDISEPEKTVTLDLSPLSIESVVSLMMSLSKVAFQPQIVVFPSSQGWEKELQGALNRAGGSIEREADSDLHVIKFESKLL